MKHVQNYEITNDYLKRRHFLFELWTGHLELLQCPTIQFALHESLKIKWRNQTLKSGETKIFSPSGSPLSKHPHNSLPCCWCSLHIWINVLKHLYTSFNNSKTVGQLWNPHGPLLRLRLRFTSPSKILCFWISTIWLRVCSWLWDFGNQNIFSIVCTNLRACLICWVWCQIM
jgi:hypothetical protein